jgi:hypothetical protein
MRSSGGSQRLNWCRRIEIALTFQVPNSIYRFWIESNYLNVVQSAAISVLGSQREVKYRAADSGMSGPVC